MKKSERFDTRWTKEQKERYERAAVIGNYSSLSAFVNAAIEEKAEQIEIKEFQVLASEEDRKVFFDAISKSIKPNDALKSAADDYENK